MGLTWGSVPCPESWSPHTGQCAGWRVPHTGFTHVGRTGHRADQGQGTCETSGWWSCSCGCRPISSPRSEVAGDPSHARAPWGVTGVSFAFVIIAAYMCLRLWCEVHISSEEGIARMWLPGQVWMGVWFYSGGAVSRGFIFLSRSW